ncbi:MAG: hypothetical protein ACI4QU_03985, partial [Christensenellales bacterium]
AAGNVCAAAHSEIKEISYLLDALLPLPFANSSAKAIIYIDSYTNKGTGVDGGIKSIELYIDANRATTTSSSSDYLQLVIQPTTASDNLLSICEVESVSIPSGQQAAPTRINLIDPSTREAQAVYGSTKKSIFLTADYFINEKLFPQTANVTFSDGTSDNYGGGSGYGENGGVQIVWDASSVDLTTSHTNSERLVGYVYGYVMNKVVYVIPVYTTNSYSVSSITGYTRTSAGKFVASELAVDMKAYDTAKAADNTSFYVSLPDSVQITFENGNSYTFSTEYADYAEFGTTGREAYVEYAKYLKEKFGFTGTVATSASGTDTFTGVKSNFPVGKITWNEKDFVYDWVGGTVDVSYTFSWGLSGTYTETVTVPIKNYKIGEVTKFDFVDGSNVVTYKLNNLQSFDSSKLVVYDSKNEVFKNGVENFFVDDNMDPVTVTSENYTNYAFDLYSYIKSFNRIEGNYATYSIDGVEQDVESYKLDLSWSYGGNDDYSGLKNLKDAIDALYDQTNKCWNYYKGIDVIVTGYVGGNTFFASEYFSGYPTDTATTKYVAATLTDASGNAISGYRVYQTLK